MTIKASIAGVSSILIASCLGGCANESGAEASFAPPAFVGANLAVMGGARGAKLESPGELSAVPVIAPTSSSKVLSAIVFERVTGLPAYPDGNTFDK
ncbi:MAG: hypothetical protein ABL894_03450 [Hyphomicrobium sp.]